MRTIARVIIALLALSLMATPVLAGDWQMAKKDAARTSYVNDTLSPPLETLWAFDAGAGIVASPVVSNGVLYYSNDTGRTLTAIDMATKRIVFQRPLAGTIESTPAVTDNMIVVGAYDGNVYGLSKTDGSVLWKTSLESGIYSSALIYRGKVFIGTDSGDFCALDQGSGKVAWALPKSPTQGSPAGDDGKVFIGLLDGNVYALNPDSGSVIWSYNTTDRIHSSPMVFDGSVYIASRSGKLYALDESTGAVRWTADLGYRTDATPAIDPATRTIFIGTFGGYMFAVDADTGDFKWVSQYYGPIYSTASVAGDVVYGCTQAGKLFALGASDGTEKWSYDLGGETWASPAIANGYLFTGTLSGRLYAFQASAAPAATATPTAAPSAAASASTPFPGIALVIAALASAAVISRMRR